MRTARRTLRPAHETRLRDGTAMRPKHSYVALPDLQALRRARFRWARASEMPGVVVDLDAQLRFLSRAVLPFEPEYRGNRAYKAAVSGGYGRDFGYVEAQALHGVVRSFKPRRVVEIGSGVSTYCMLHALSQNALEGAPASITCVEAHPSRWLETAPVHLLRQKVQNADAALFNELGEGDLLSVDSTHAVFLDSDVNLIILEVLPRLRPGVLVHFHDIAFPYGFLPDADRTLLQCMETVLLQAFLVGNVAFGVLASLSHLHHGRTADLKQVFPEYVPEKLVDGLRLESARAEEQWHFPSSTYLSVGKPPSIPRGFE